MNGPLVPLVMLPRYTSYVGPGSYSTPPLAVESYERVMLTFWRGPLVGGAVTDPFLAYLEVSHDANEWFSAYPPIDTVDPVVATSEKIVTPFTRRWFRVRVELAGDANGVVGLSMWMAGVMERKLR